MSVTCNAILRKLENGRFTYSYWYGQFFGLDEESTRKDNLLTTIYTVSSLEDLEALPERLSYEDVWSQFATTFEEGSSVSVYKITHYIVIFRRFVENVGVPTRRVPLRINI